MKVNAMGCKWEVYVSYKSVVRGQSQKTWVMGITHSEHSHPLTPNPLAYSVHQKARPEHAAALTLAQTARAANFSYGESSRLLSAPNLHLN